MAAPQLSKDWLITPNLRRAYTSINDLMSWCLYQNKVAMVAAGWTVVWSCDGTTGPVDADDHTDRWLSEADAATRGATTSNPMSYCVLQNAEGVMVRLLYMGSSDSVADIAFSTADGYTLQADTTWPPLPGSDNVTISTGNSIVNSATSLDRVMTVWCSDDTLHWCFAIFRADSLLGVFGVEKINNLCDPPEIFGDGVNEYPYVGYRYTIVTRQTALGTPIESAPNIAIGATGWTGTAARVFTAGASRLNRVGAGFIATNNQAGTNCMSTAGNIILATAGSSGAALQGGASFPAFPIYWCGERVNNLDGFLGYPIDWWQMASHNNAVPAVGDFVPGYDPTDTPGVDPVRTNWLVVVGAAFIRPWRDAAATLETA